MPQTGNTGAGANVADNSAFGGPNAQQAANANTAISAPQNANAPAAQTPAPYVAPTQTTLTSSSLNPQTPITPVQPAATPTVNVGALSPITPPLTETPNQTQESSLYSQLNNLTNQDAGKAAFTTDQYNKLGIGMTYDAKGNIVPDAGTQDLTAKLNQIKNEGLAIPMQGEQSATGVRSEQGQAPLTAAATRTNAINALQVSSAIDALNGNLLTAQAKVNQAVIQKFGPIEAQMTALEANLKNIIADPNTTIQEKNAAQAQQDNVDAQKTQIADAKAQQADIWTLATTAASYKGNFTPTPQYQTAAQAITAIQQAPDKATALKIAMDSGLTAAKAPVKLDTSVQEVNGQKVLIDNQTGQQIKDLGSAATYSELHLKDAATTAAQTLVTNTVNNIVDGNTSLSDLTTASGADPANVQNVKAQLQTMGFYSDTPPAWYVQHQNDNFGKDASGNVTGGDILPNVIQAKWLTYKDKALNGPSS